MTRLIITGSEDKLTNLLDRLKVRRYLIDLEYTIDEEIEGEDSQEEHTGELTLDDYQRLANTTSGAGGEQTIGRLLCASLGLVGEAGELGNLVKKMVYHKHPDVKDKIKEEAGDALWYIAEICSTEGWSLGEVALENYLKLSRRYPNGFSYEASANRKE